jgi:hypothetical protein
MIEKQIFVDQIEVVSSGIVQVRTKTLTIENGQVIGQMLHRHVVVPGNDYSNEDARVQAICAATHTPEVIATYQAAQAAQGV